jgi:hypothetical protein
LFFPTFDDPILNQHRFHPSGSNLHVLPAHTFPYELLSSEC